MHLILRVEMELMIRGEIYYADLNPTRGSEINKTRPVLIISNNSNNKYSDTITIIPVTSNINKIYPFEVLLSKEESGLRKDSKAQCHQIRTISKEGIMGAVIGLINNNKIQAIKAALSLHLDL